MGDALKIVGYYLLQSGWLYPVPLPSGSQVPANEDIWITAQDEDVTVEGASNYDIFWSGDLGSNPRFGDDITDVGHPGINSVMQTWFVPGTHTFEAKGAKGGSTITLTAVDTGGGGGGGGPCKLTGINPPTKQLFVRSKPFTFTASGTGSLAKVRWKANGGAKPATGTGATFTTKWSKTGPKTVTASCGGKTETATVSVFDLEIQVNNTESTKDDIVQVKSDHPLRFFIVPCQIRVKDPRPTPDVRIELLDPNQKLQFSLPTDTTFDNLLTFDLPTDGKWKPFQIIGEVASEKKGDAHIKAFYSSEAVAEKNVTVFSFDKAEILLEQGGNYRFLVPDPSVPNVYEYTVPHGHAVTLKAKATLSPAGLDCTAPQIANLRIGIMQNVYAFVETQTWDTPTIEWKNAHKGDTVEVETMIRRRRAWPSTVVPPVNDGFSNSNPLFSTIVGFPIGCAGGGEAETSDTPDIVGFLTTSEDFSKGTVTWQRLLSATVEKHCRTFCVIYDIAAQPPVFCALRQADWSVKADSSKGENQHALVPNGGRDEAVSSNPATPPPQFRTVVDTDFIAVGTGKTKFTKES